MEVQRAAVGAVLAIRRYRIMNEAARTKLAQGSVLVGTIARDVTWGDCDPAGIIYYPTYFRWIDAGTWNLFFAAGFTPASLRAEYPGMDMPAGSSAMEFRFPPTFGDKVEVRSHVEHWGGKSFKVLHEIVRTDGVLLANGRETRVWVRNAPGEGLRSHAIPESLKKRFVLPG